MVSTSTCLYTYHTCASRYSQVKRVTRGLTHTHPPVLRTNHGGTVNGRACYPLSGCACTAMFAQKCRPYSGNRPTGVKTLSAITYEISAALHLSRHPPRWGTLPNVGRTTKKKLTVLVRTGVARRSYVFNDAPYKNRPQY